MKTITALVMLALGIQLYAQDQIQEEPIQNFYTTCRPDKISAFSFKNEGIQLFLRGKYKQSIERFHTSLEKDNSLCDSWYLIGYSYQKLGDYEKSVESCDISIEMNRWSISAHMIKGYSMLFLNDTSAAISSFKEAKEIGPDKIDPYYGLALISFLQNDYRGARKEIAEYRENKVKKTSRRDGRKLNSLEEKIGKEEQYSMRSTEERQ